MKSIRAGAVALLVLMGSLAVASPGGGSVALYKCAGGEGPVSYQSQPCAPGQSQVWAREVVPEPVPGEAGAPVGRAAPVPAAARRPAARTRVATRPVPPRKSASAACLRARAADAAYRAQPLSRVNHDGLRRHGDRIRAACG